MLPGIVWIGLQIANGAADDPFSQAAASTGIGQSPDLGDVLPRASSLAALLSTRRMRRGVRTAGTLGQSLACRNLSFVGIGVLDS
jgi:hypothetical protein